MIKQKQIGAEGGDVMDGDERPTLVVPPPSTPPPAVAFRRAPALPPSDDVVTVRPRAAAEGDGR